MEYLNRREFAANAGIAINTCTNRYQNNRLIAFESTDKDGVKHRLKFPSWQIKNGEILEGIEYVLAIIQANGMLAIRMLTAELNNFDGKTIVELLHEGDLPEALEAAHYLVEVNKSLR